MCVMCVTLVSIQSLRRKGILLVCVGLVLCLSVFVFVVLCLSSLLVGFRPSLLVFVGLCWSLLVDFDFDPCDRGHCGKKRGGVKLQCSFLSSRLGIVHC